MAPPPVVPGTRPPPRRRRGRRHGVPAVTLTGSRGGPGEQAARLARAEALLAAGEPGTAGPLRLAAAVVRFQMASSAGDGGAVAVAGRVAAGADDRLAAGRFPLLDLDAAAGPMAGGITAAVAALDQPAGAPAAGRGGGSSEPLLPAPLAGAGRSLAAASAEERRRLAEAWLEDPAAVDPLAAFWASVPGGAVLETARVAIPTPSREEWAGAACPVCGGPPQVSVIAPETGEFMGGSPRSLVCGRCAGWWAFPRATCVWCGEDDPRRLAPYLPERAGPARIDACESCGAYIKTFDLRREGTGTAVPLVDDIATVSLDLWAQERGLRRLAVSLAGV